MIKNCFFILLTLMTCDVLAQEYKTMDIINKSDMAITLTYYECQYDVLDIYNCTEKKLKLNKKGGGTNFIIYPSRKENDKNPNLWILKKIVSPLGEQNFIPFSSFQELGEIKRNVDNTDKVCWAANLPNSSNVDDKLRIIVLDNMGTKKFYCEHLNVQS